MNAMRYALIGALFFTAPATLLHAQQAAQHSLFMYNPFHGNPAYAGLDYAISLLGGVRQQWVGLQGAPATQFLAVHAPLEVLGGGVGIKMERDLYGAERNNWASLAYSLHLPLGSGTLGLSVGAGMLQKALDGEKLRTPQGIYQNNLFDHKDATLPSNAVQGMAPTLEAGAFFQSPTLEAGIGIRHLNAPYIDFPTFRYAQKPTAFAHLGLNLELGGQFSLHPTVQVRSDVVQTQTDAALHLRYRQIASLGALLRGYNSKSLDAAALLASFALNKQWELAYAYDLSLSPIRQVHDGSHEVLLIYTLPGAIGARRAPRTIYNPRNL